MVHSKIEQYAMAENCNDGIFKTLNQHLYDFSIMFASPLRPLA